MYRPTSARTFIDPCPRFVLKMVAGFFADPGNNPSSPGNPQENEADVGYWTGILVSVFFITQFITSLLWATVADKHGRRAVLFVSLLGNALTCTFFGFANNLPMAILIRLAQGVFNGAVGVARGTVAGITDTSNEGRAYAIMGLVRAICFMNLPSNLIVVSPGVWGVLLVQLLEVPSNLQPINGPHSSLGVDSRSLSHTLICSRVSSQVALPV